MCGFVVFTRLLVLAGCHYPLVSFCKHPKKESTHKNYPSITLHLKTSPGSTVPDQRDTGITQEDTATIETSRNPNLTTRCRLRRREEIRKDRLLSGAVSKLKPVRKKGNTVEGTRSLHYSAAPCLRLWPHQPLLFPRGEFCFPCSCCPKPQGWPNAKFQ